MSTAAVVAEGLIMLAKTILPGLIEKHGGNVKDAVLELADTYESRRTEKMPDVSGEVAANQAGIDAILAEREKSGG